MGTVNWGKLVSQGRAKAIGISWSNEELEAVYKLKIPAEYVRKGILTLDDYEKAKVKGLEPSKTKEELMAEAKEAGVNVTPEATKESLESVLPKKPIRKVVRKVKKMKPKK